MSDDDTYYGTRDRKGRVTALEPDLVRDAPMPAATESVPPPADASSLSARVEALMLQITRDMSALAMALLLAEAKQYYEEEFPETRPGGNHQVARVATCCRFTLMVAKRTGLSESTVRNRLQAGEAIANLTPEALDLCWGTPAANKLGFLARVAAIPDTVLHQDLVTLFDRSQKRATAELVRWEVHYGLVCVAETEGDGGDEASRETEESSDGQADTDAEDADSTAEAVPTTTSPTDRTGLHEELAKIIRALGVREVCECVPAIVLLQDLRQGSANDNSVCGALDLAPAADADGLLPLPAALRKCAETGASGVSATVAEEHLRALVDLGLLSRERERLLGTKKGRESVESQRFVAAVGELGERGLVTLLREYRAAEEAAFPRGLTPDGWRDAVASAVGRVPQQAAHRVSCVSGESPQMTIGVDAVQLLFLYDYEGTLEVAGRNGRRFLFGSPAREHSAKAFEEFLFYRLMRELGYWRTASGDWADSQGNRAYGGGPADLSAEEREDVETRVWLKASGFMP